MYVEDNTKMEARCKWTIRFVDSYEVWMKPSSSPNWHRKK
jgi:hypothetical protein